MQQNATKSLGQLAYEQELAIWPHYHDGEQRKPWDQLPDYAKMSWEKNPLPRTQGFLASI